MKFIDPENIADYLAKERENVPEELQGAYLEIEDLWDRKLWRELTEALQTFYGEPATEAIRISLFTNFIQTFQDKVNQLKFVELALVTVQDYKDDKDQLAFLDKVTKNVKQYDSQDAYVYGLVSTAEIKLRLKQIDEAQQDLKTAEAQLDKADLVETVVHAAFYKTNAAYHQGKLNFAQYYRNALLYLACIDVESLSPAEAQRRAHDLSIAALASDTIYNFGELLLHPILSALDGTSHAWLKELLFAFNKGDLSKFEALQNHLSQNPVLAERKQFLWQKISLAALTEAVFRRPPHDRAMSFGTIADETRVQPHEIEILLMKALSLGLLKGSIDQVAEVARIHWVQPKVLDLKQVDGMRTQLQQWDTNIDGLGRWIEGVGKDIWPA